MEDRELIELRNLKEKLLDRTNGLCEKLENHEVNHRKFLSFDKLASNTTKDILNIENTLHADKKLEFSKVIRQVIGIKFENTDRKWMNDNIFKYTTKLVTSVLEFFVELTVKIQGEDEFEIQDIICHFINIDNCYMLEIKSWIQDICRKKNFSLLVSAVSQYSETYKIRKTILEQLEKKKYGTWKQCVETNGGIKLFLHSSEDIKKHHVYLQFQWSIIFLKKFWKSQHYFSIQPTPEGTDFAKKNQDLLRSFCKRCITIEELRDLFHNICNAIDMYQNN